MDSVLKKAGIEKKLANVTRYQGIKLIKSKLKIQHGQATDLYNRWREIYIIDGGD